MGMNRRKCKEVDIFYILASGYSLEFCYKISCAKKQSRGHHLRFFYYMFLGIFETYQLLGVEDRAGVWL